MAHKLILRKDYSGHFFITVELNPLSQLTFILSFLDQKLNLHFIDFEKNFHGGISMH